MPLVSRNGTGCHLHGCVMQDFNLHPARSLSPSWRVPFGEASSPTGEAREAKHGRQPRADQELGPRPSTASTASKKPSPATTQLKELEVNPSPGEPSEETQPWPTPSAGSCEKARGRGPSSPVPQFLAHRNWEITHRCHSGAKSTVTFDSDRKSIQERV